MNTDGRKELRKLIDIPQSILDDIQILAQKNNKTLKRFIEDTLIDKVLARRNVQLERTNNQKLNTVVRHWALSHPNEANDAVKVKVITHILSNYRPVIEEAVLVSNPRLDDITFIDDISIQSASGEMNRHFKTSIVFQNVNVEIEGLVNDDEICIEKASSSRHPGSI